MDSSSSASAATSVAERAAAQPATPVALGAGSVHSAANKVVCFAPASPAAIVSESPTAHATSSPVSGAPAASSTTAASAPAVSALSTPKKNFLDSVMLQRIREKLRTPGGACELQSLHLECSVEPVNVIKDRYLISAQPSHLRASATIKTRSSYRHLVDLTSSNFKCTDVFTGEQFLCKVINEPLYKVQRAYFQLRQDADQCRSSIYGHTLIRGVKDIVPLSSQRTYVIVAAPQARPCADPEATEVYEDLHTYIRNKRRLCEAEARALFHQICETVRVCHRNGIILRDLKLKRFYFIDEARTKLQYESLEGSMILDNPADDTLSDKIGCPLYTAPELLCPNPTYQGKPADMWSLGVILYTMLVGQYPFYEKGSCNLITIIRHSNVQIPGNLSKSVRWLLLALLRKNYTERIPAEHIFMSPWLREQRPFHMYVPVDVVIPDDEELCPADETNDMNVDETEDGVQPLDYSYSGQAMNGDPDAEMG